MRKYTDAIGDIYVADENLWGATTQRSLENFKIGSYKMPKEQIRALALLKKACAKANFTLNNLSYNKYSAISMVCDKILQGELDSHFPLNVFQTGSGTQSNMNLNELIANYANIYLQDNLQNQVLHPNDDVNKSQSSNDIFPSAMHVAITLASKQKLNPSLEKLHKILLELSYKFADKIKVGRTHCQDAVPMTVGQEISAFAASVTYYQKKLSSAIDDLRVLAIGGTAVGTGLNCDERFAPLAVEALNVETGLNFTEADNKFAQLSLKDELSNFHAVLSSLASALFKQANDLRLLASGPRCGLAEFILPANEPGSSIMPGKVNPTQIEALTMVCVRIMANDTCVKLANSQGQFQLNTFMPLIVFTILESVDLLSSAIDSFVSKCLEGLELNENKLQKNLDNTLMTVTALNSLIGYEQACKCAKKAYQSGAGLLETALAMRLEAAWDVSEKDIKEALSPAKMLGIKKKVN